MVSLKTQHRELKALSREEGNAWEFQDAVFGIRNGPKASCFKQTKQFVLFGGGSGVFIRWGQWRPERMLDLWHCSYRLL